MDIQSPANSTSRLSTTSLHALTLGAVVTIPVQLSSQQFGLLRYKPGDEIEMETENEREPTFRCCILDIESIKTDDTSAVRMRITLRKA